MQAQHPQGEEPAPLSAGDIEELARRLHQAHHLDPQTRARVAGLMDELAAELGRPETSEQTDHLARIVAQLVRALEGRHAPGVVQAARERLENAIARAEARSTTATDIGIRLIDVLTGLGI